MYHNCCSLRRKDDGGRAIYLGARVSRKWIKISSWNKARFQRCVSSSVCRVHFMEGSIIRRISRMCFAMEATATRLNDTRVSISCKFLGKFLLGSTPWTLPFPISGEGFASLAASLATIESTFLAREREIFEKKWPILAKFRPIGSIRSNFIFSFIGTYYINVVNMDIVGCSLRLVKKKKKKKTRKIISLD